MIKYGILALVQFSFFTYIKEENIFSTTIAKDIHILITRWPCLSEGTNMTLHNMFNIHYFSHNFIILWSIFLFFCYHIKFIVFYCLNVKITKFLQPFEKYYSYSWTLIHIREYDSYSVLSRTRTWLSLFVCFRLVQLTPDYTLSE